MPPSSHEHAHTPLGVKRTNASAIKWATIVGAVVAVANALSAAIAAGALVVPVEVHQYLPWLVFFLDIVAVVGAALGLPSYHPGLAPKQLHVGPLEHHHDPGGDL